MDRRVRNRFLIYLIKLVGYSVAGLLYVYGGLVLSKIYFDSFNPFYAFTGLVFSLFIAIYFCFRHAEHDVYVEDFHNKRKR